MCRSLLATAVIFYSCANLFAQETKPEPPRIAVAAPLLLPVGAKTKMTLRGWRLTDITAVRIISPAGTPLEAKILQKGAAPTIDKFDPKRIGDQQVEVECDLPADFAPAEGQLIVVGPAGESSPLAIWLGGEFPVTIEREPNDGFRQAQVVTLPQIVSGSIHANQNVDVFAFDLSAGQKVSCAVFAARRGSAMDPLLAIYDARGSLIASNDDTSDSRDADLEFTASTAGRYFVTLLDAHDRGSAVHPYVLKMSVR